MTSGAKPVTGQQPPPASAGMRLAILGGGKIGEALLSGLLRGPMAVDQIVISEHSPDRAEYLAQKYLVRALSVEAAVRASDVLLIAVKPQDIGTLLAEIAPHATNQVVISVAAGITTKRIEADLAPGTPVVRTMPNTPALVDQAMTAISPGAHASEEHLAAAETVLGSVGRVIRVPESQLDAVTALSGSGPAYFFFLVEAMIDAGILLGLPRAVAAELIVQTALGSATMLRDSGEHPVQLREAVTSPGGTTIMAIRELERHGVRAALLAAIEAARDRSVELGKATD
ncbi:MAG: pyrroline-5-carboxylate reductase [Geodermatophilaceae bacterium]